jgi:signal transduction histidine kinase
MIATEDAVADRVLTRRDRVVDAVVAGTLLLATIGTLPLSASAMDAPTPGPLVLVPWAIAITVPLALRRSAPTIVAVVVVLSFIAGQALRLPEAVVSQIAPFLALYTLGAWSPRRRRATGVRIALSVLLALWFLLSVSLSRIDPQSAPAAIVLSALSTALYLAAAIAFGDAAWRSAVRRTALERRTNELQAERELTSRQAVALDRIRIARELHDVVAHHVSVMGVQAGAARRVLTTRPENTAPALDALRHIEESSRQAVEELGRTVTWLRGSDADGAEPSFAPSTAGIAQIDHVIRESEASGMTVEYTVEGDPSVVLPSTALALHRMVQESLTNVRKHAGPSETASVLLVIRSERIDLTITDSGGTDSRPAPGTGTGTGQLGMRERAIAAGGTIEMGPSVDGYRVHAVLPVRP